MAVSQKQIAERLGVSIALVSRVLSGKAAAIGVAPETIERVSRAAREMGYVPNAAALTLKGKSSHTIGVAVYDFNDPFFGALIKKIQVLAHEHTYSLVLTGFLNRVPDKQDLLALHKHSIDGLLVLGSDAEAQWLRDFRHLPVARIGHGNDAEGSVRITVDEQDAAQQLVGHLAVAGKKNLVYVSGGLPAHRLRRGALEKASSDAGLGFAAVPSGQEDPFAAGVQAAREVLGKAKEADALVCATDSIALGALHALTEAGVDVPGRLAVTGFDDIPFAAQSIPPLTTVRQPLGEMVRQAFRAVMEPAPPKVLRLPGELVIRQTG